MKDPIIDEIRKIRRDIEAECGNDAEGYFNYLQNIQKKYKNWYVENKNHAYSLKQNKKTCRLPTDSIV